MKASRIAWGALILGALFAAPAASQEPTPALPIRPAAPQEGQEPAKPAPEQAKAPIYDEKADAKAQIAAAVARAHKADKRVLIQWGANWCGWCHLLHDLFASDRGIATELRNEYEVVLVDMGRFDKNKDLAEGYGAEIKGIPFLTVLDASGKVLVNQPTDPLEEGRKHSPAKVMEFLKQHQVPAQDAETVLIAARARAKHDDKMVFLHFGAPWCGWCHKLEDWMAREEVGKLLAKDFVDVKIDEDRMAGAKGVEQRYGQSGGIPWIAFLDAQGKVLVTSDAPGGNIGYPAKPEEIEYFVTMLNKVKKNLTSDDVAALERSLQPEPKKEAKEAAKEAGSRVVPAKLIR